MVRAEDLRPGDPREWGAHLLPDDGGVRFAVWAPEATAVWWCLFDDTGTQELARLPVPWVEEGVWHLHWPAGRAGCVYGWRADGPWSPGEGLRFNPQRLLLDPFACEVVGRYAPAGDAGLDAYLDHDPQNPLKPHPQDNAAVALKARVRAAVVAPERTPPPRPVDGPRVIAEVHVRSASQCHPEVPEALRGRYAALAHPALIAHWKRLGVTTLELMPVQARADEARLQRQGLSNHWGYSPIAWMAPEPRYASGQNGSSAEDELRDAITALRAAGFEVVLDMVFNHTGETDLTGPCLSMKGLAHRHWYRTEADASGPHGALTNWTGCGNTLNLGEPQVVRAVVDALRHWVRSYGVDGFRFDLAPILGRDGAGQFTGAAAFWAACASDPWLRHCLMIAEPWDVGPHGYRLGQHPVGWLEWNDRARDALRAYWLRPDDRRATRAELASRLAGSSDLFHADPRRPRRASASINFVTAHDGFTLRDLVSHDHRHNEANGEHNRDGHADNLSWNCGAEGDTADAGVRDTRLRLQRALLTTLLLARGTPMLLMGDELGHSQQGNNNAYCQDNDITWLDWSHPEAADLCALVARAVAWRRHDAASHESTWWMGQRKDSTEPPDVRWSDAEGQPLDEAGWHRPEQDARALQVHLAPPGQGFETLWMFNPGDEDRAFTLPSPARGDRGGVLWRAVLDSARHGGAPLGDAESDVATVRVSRRSVQVWSTGGWNPVDEAGTVAGAAATPIIGTTQPEGVQRAQRADDNIKQDGD
jgi:glycogen debranching enzyme